MNKKIEEINEDLKNKIKNLKSLSIKKLEENAKYISKILGNGQSFDSFIINQNFHTTYVNYLSNNSHLHKNTKSNIKIIDKIILFNNILLESKNYYELTHEYTSDPLSFVIYNLHCTELAEYMLQKQYSTYIPDEIVRHFLNYPELTKFYKNKFNIDDKKLLNIVSEYQTDPCVLYNIIDLNNKEIFETYKQLFKDGSTKDILYSIDNNIICAEEKPFFNELFLYDDKIREEIIYGISSVILYNNQKTLKNITNIINNNEKLKEEFIEYMISSNFNVSMDQFATKTKLSSSLKTFKFLKLIKFDSYKLLEHFSQAPDLLDEFVSVFTKYKNLKIFI